MNGKHDEPRNWEDEQEAIEARQVMDRLNEQHRILWEARMPTVKLTDEQLTTIIEHFKAYIAQHDVTAGQVAREIQYSPTVVSQWMARTYRGSVEGVTDAINNWMERDSRRRQARRPKDYVRTWIAEDIRTYCYMADKHCTMAVIVAPAGTGKTKVLKALTEELRAIYVCCTPNMTLRGLYWTLAKQLGWTRVNGNTYELEQYIVERLKGTNINIFIDEAHLLGPSIRTLRTIHDQAGTPIIFVGTDEIEHSVDDRQHGRGQFSSRCIYYNALDHAYHTEGPDGSAAGKHLFTVDEIKKYFDKRKIRIDRDGFKMLWALACLPGYGSLRMVERIIDVAFTLNPDAEQLTRDDVLSALRMVESRRFVLLQRLANQHIEKWDELPATIAAAG